MIDQITNNRLKKENYIASGPFVFDESAPESQYGFQRITLKKNPNFLQTVWLDKFNFKIFGDMASLERGIDTTHIVLLPNNRDSIKASAIFQPHKYTHYEFFGAFFNTKTLDKNIRNILHGYFAKQFSETPIATTGQIPTNTIFDNGDPITGVTPKMNITEFMAAKGYEKKQIIMKRIAETPIKITTAEIPKMKYFKNGGGYAILFSDDPKGEIALFGKVPDTTVSVAINDYFLQEYTTGSNNFVYKVSSENNTLKHGKNTYQLSLKQKDGSILSEMLTIYHSTNAEEIKNWHDTVNTELVAIANLPEKLAKREAEKQQKLAEIAKLADNTYYNEKYEPFTLKVAFMSEKQASQDAVEHMSAVLDKLGIVVNAEAISTKEMESLIKSKKRDYDILVVGIRSPGTISHMGEAFFSSANGNPNFSQISSPYLENLFLELQRISDSQKMQELQTKIIAFMNEESIFLPISKPQKTLYVDRNLKGFTLAKTIGSYSDLFKSFGGLSIKDYYQKNLNDKSISGFFSWIFHSVSSSKKQNS